MQARAAQNKQKQNERRISEYRAAESALYSRSKEMTVIKRKRKLAPDEYVTQFIGLYKFALERLDRMAKRKWVWLAQPIIDEMNSIMDELLSIHNPFYAYGINEYGKSERANIIIRRIIRLQKPLLALWNVEQYTINRMAMWAEMIDREIYYLSIMGGLHIQKGKRFMCILDYDAINKMDFMKTMCELHRFVYSKTISLPANCRNSSGSMLMNLADDALYHITMANQRIPTTRWQYKKRAKHIAAAIDSLNHMQVPLIAVFNVMNYSESTMFKWCDLLKREIDMLAGLQKSDRQRFQNLK